MMPTPSNTFHNQSLENWNVSQVTNMHFMFRGAKVSTNPLVVGMSVVFLIWIACFTVLPISISPFRSGMSVRRVTYMDYMSHNVTSFN